MYQVTRALEGPTCTTRATPWCRHHVLQEATEAVSTTREEHGQEPRERILAALGAGWVRQYPWCARLGSLPCLPACAPQAGRLLLLCGARPMLSVSQQALRSQGRGEDDSGALAEPCLGLFPCVCGGCQTPCRRSDVPRRVRVCERQGSAPAASAPRPGPTCSTEGASQVCRCFTQRGRGVGSRALQPQGWQTVCCRQRMMP